jgi:hypothetical protein
VRSHLLQVNHGRLDELLIEAGAVTVLGQIALGFRQLFQELRFQPALTNLFRQLDGAPGILDDLHRLDPRELIEEPAATGVHQQGMALELE